MTVQGGVGAQVTTQGPVVDLSNSYYMYPNGTPSIMLIHSVHIGSNNHSWARDGSNVKKQSLVW